jgi:hypothetical protein
MAAQDIMAMAKRLMGVLDLVTAAQAPCQKLRDSFEAPDGRPHLTHIKA